MIGRRLLTLLFLVGFASCAALLVWAEDAQVMRPPVQYEAFQLRDPFKSALPKKGGVGDEDLKGGPPALSVTGVLWGSKVPQAIINGKVVKAGDVIQNAEIIAIDKEGVTVRYGDQEYLIDSPVAAAIQAKKPKDLKGGEDEK